MISYCKAFFSVPSGTPANFTGFSYSPNSVTLSWDPPVFSTQNGIITSYSVRVENPDGSQAETLEALGTSFVVTNLSPYTTYNFFVAASTIVGTGPFISTFAITLEDGKLQDLHSSTGSTHVTINRF